MSFRWNIQRDVSDRSFFTQGNQLIATSIGVTGNRSALSCRLNVDQKDYKYCKTQQQILESLTLVEKKMKRWAFRAIQKITHYHREVSNSIFVPEALSKGDYGVLQKFVGKLRNSRINSYIKLNLEESYGYFHKAATLLKPAARIVKERMQYAFIRLKVNMTEKQKAEQNKILIDIERYSSIENQNSILEQVEHLQKKDVINVSYVLVKVNPETMSNPSGDSGKKSNYTPKKARINGKTQSYIDLSDLIEVGRIRQYQFKQVKHVNHQRINTQRVIRNT